MKSDLFKYNLLLHITVLLFGFTGILGKLITVSGEELVWYRMWIAVVSLAGIMIVAKAPFKITGREFLELTGIGIIVALHWVAFFVAIKVSNVSIALACLSSGTLFAALLEPIFFRSSISLLEIIIGFIIIAAILLILNVEYQYAWGIFAGLIAAFLSSLFTVLNKKITHRYNSLTMSLYELLGGVIPLTIYFIVADRGIFDIRITGMDLLWLVILGTLCTAFAFWATNRILLKLSAYHVVLAVNLEPIYAFLLAAWIFHEHEHLTLTFYIGAFMILFSVAVYSYIKYARYKKTLMKKS